MEDFGPAGPDDLGRHELHCSCGSHKPIVIVALEKLAYAEVAQNKVSLTIYKQVIRFDIPVCNVCNLMAVVKRRH